MSSGARRSALRICTLGFHTTSSSPSSLRSLSTDSSICASELGRAAIISVALCLRSSVRMDTVKDIWSVGMGMAQAPRELQREQDGLQTKLLSARSLISRSEWGMFKNMELDALLVKLKYTTYDAEDLLREYQDKALRQKLEDAGRCRAGHVLSSSLNIVKHVILDSSKRLKDTQDKLDKVMAQVKEVLSSMGLDRVEPVQFMPTTTEIITASQVYGRDTERDQLMEMLGLTATIDREDEMNQVFAQLITQSVSKGKTTAAASPGVNASMPKSAKRHKGDNSSSASARLAHTTNFSGNLSVLPIFGIGGMGKTTLAQLIFNDQRVQAHFNERIWVCVSDLFDIERMIKEIFRTICDPNSDLSIGLAFLKLKEKLKSKKFLLVLDDIWQITQLQWESFYACLRDGLEGSMILVTTRHENIAHLVATSNCEPVQLKGLPPDIFWEFFKKCAFGKERPESYPRLQEIGRRISSKLCGTPLAAKTLGRLLNSNLTEEHWISINKSELWEQKQQDGEILPALRLSYLYLPPELRRCFAFCCMFPRDYSFERHEIVDIWVAEGFVAPQGNMCLEDIGIQYLDELRGRCLFQSDPLFPNNHKKYYAMHDLVHDTAKHVSMHECLLMTDLSYLGRHEFRHMSVEVDAKSLSAMKNIQHLNKLRSLRFGIKLDAEITWFSQLSNILFLSLKGCRLKKLPESICELNSLRYLDISNNYVKELPEKFWCLYSLQVVDATCSGLKTIHRDVTKLINLRQLALPEEARIALSKVSRLGNLSCLRNLSYFTVGNQKGAIAELKGMNQLRGTLCIKSVHNVQSKEDAAIARLVDKKYLTELELNWRQCTISQMPSPGDNEVADGLRPNERIQCLKVHGFRGNRLPSWFNPGDLQNLRSLELSSCHCFGKTLSIPNLTGGTQVDSTGQHASSGTNYSKRIPSLAFTHLTSLSIVGCKLLTNLDQFLSPKHLLSIKIIFLSHCADLESIPAKFVGFVHLRDLKLSNCGSLICPQSREMVFPHSLRRLYINRCGQLDRSFPYCLEKLTSLTVLCLRNCDNVESIPLDLIPCRNTLKCLRLENCPKLSDIGESDVPSSMKCVDVSDCAKLTQVSQPYRRNALSVKAANEIKEFIVDPL